MYNQQSIFTCAVIPIWPKFADIIPASDVVYNLYTHLLYTLFCKNHLNVNIQPFAWF